VTTNRAPQTRSPRLSPVKLGRLTPVEVERFVDGDDDLEAVEVTEIERTTLDWPTRRRLDSSRVVGLRIEQWRAHGLAMAETVLERTEVMSVHASDSGWRRVEVRDSRIGSAELSGSVWRGVHFSGCKLGYLNLRDAQVSDLLFSNCLIEELDLMRAKATRVAFVNCRLRRLELTRSTLADVDLRGVQLSDVGDLAGLSGATVSLEQLLDLAPLMAARLGVLVE
jgi:uncharacterized protein YjbI with pentapeptide repeats